MANAASTASSETTTTFVPVKSAALQQASNIYQSSAFSPMFVNVPDGSEPPSPPLTTAESAEQTSSSPLSAGQLSPLSATSGKSPTSGRVLTPAEARLIKHLLCLQKGA
jgi:hypothetical protein